jgi:hypothetical protein
MAQILDDSLPFINSIVLAVSIMVGMGYSYFIAVYIKNK